MPTSYVQAIPSVVDAVLRAAPSSVLDVGVGFGKYGLLLREATDVAAGRYRPDEWRLRIDGIEIFAPYRTPVHDYAYNRVYYGDMFEVLERLPVYDVVLLIDVLEHVPKEDGRRLIDKLLSRAGKKLIVSTPLYPAPQGDYRGNVHETHRSRWTLVDFQSWDSCWRLVPTPDGGAQIVEIDPPANWTDCPADRLVARAAENTGSIGRLDVAFALPHLHLTGGIKILLEYARRLRERGHRTRVYHTGGKHAGPLPAWSDVAVDEAASFSDSADMFGTVRDCDAIVLGWVRQLENSERSQVPLFYLEQGYPWLFGDVSDVDPDAVRSYLRSQYRRPVPIGCVSSFLADVLRVRYGRTCAVVPNGVDTAAFSPGSEREGATVLLVGPASERFKDFTTAVRVLRRVWEEGTRFQVLWICQTPPTLLNCPFPVRFAVCPPQDELPDLYRSADLLLYTSQYEGFGLPPLEAMACGIPVVAAACGGIDGYAEHGKNALLAPPGDVEALAAHVRDLLVHPDKRRFLGRQGRTTALRFDWSAVVPRMERILASVAQFKNPSSAIVGRPFDCQAPLLYPPL
ncbi:MAG: hypothetical protein BLM47_00480 [Candidatus Reconcilbacillus cellulovorans]|uniref:Glycosyl transferase family 1 domain-containing protein n=1 Tax=Candidatus Reconcilbacillus cellulovorans TaxID=1906605 RepID=A0A2A6E2V3_9BACL|nr:MAG: hypothetical protein BLM47_00480 [Candidatus Reconcilbacillus cellulovorans]